MLFNAGTAIHGQLVAQGVNSGTAIYHFFAKTSQAYPYVVITPSSSRVIQDDSVDRRDEVWQVKCVSDSPVTAGSVANTIRSALDYRNFNIDSGWVVLTITHETEFFFLEMVNDEPIYHAGGEYRLYLASATHHT